MQSRSILLSLCLLGCAAVDDDPDAGRRQWLHQQLTAENAFWLTRSPEWLAIKYEKMAADHYNYMRGSAGTYYSDQVRTATRRTATAFLQTPDALQIWLVGDAHPENLGVMLNGSAVPPRDDTLPADRTLSLEFNDLDAATFGPWLLDLRRSALGMQALTLNLAGCAEDCRAAITRAQAEGYLDGALGRPAPDETGALLDDLLDEAHEEGPERKKLLKYTVEDKSGDGGGERTLAFDAALDEELKGIFPVTPEERAQLERLLVAYDAPAGLRVLDMGRRMGAGISSLPAVRYVVLCDRGEDGSDDDDLLNIRELVDPPRVPGLLAEPGERFADNAARIRAAQQWTWTVPDADGAADAMVDPVQQSAFKVLTWSSWFQDIEHDRVEEKWAEGDVEEADLIALGRRLGHALGAAHRRAPTASGADAAAVLEAELAGREATLIDELTASAEADLTVMLADQVLFQQLLEETGGLLGMDTLVQDIP